MAPGNNKVTEIDLSSKVPTLNINSSYAHTYISGNDSKTYITTTDSIGDNVWIQPYDNQYVWNSPSVVINPPLYDYNFQYSYEELNRHNPLSDEEIKRMSKIIAKSIDEKLEGTIFSKASGEKDEVKNEVEMKDKWLCLSYNPKEKEEKMSNRRKRLVEVFVVDPHLDVADEESVLYHQEAFVTSKSDNDLLFEINVKELLDAHNVKRVKMVDETKSEGRDKDVMLKKAKVSDLSMRVREVGTF